MTEEQEKKDRIKREEKLVDAVSMIPERLGEIREDTRVTLEPPGVAETSDQALWVAIRNRTIASSFHGTRKDEHSGGYKGFIDRVLCEGTTAKYGTQKSTPATKRADALQTAREQLDFRGVGAYELLRTATEVFLLLECGLFIKDEDRYSGGDLLSSAEEASRLKRVASADDLRTELSNYLGDNKLPYIDRVLSTAFSGSDPVDSVFCDGYLDARAERPCFLELIWSYWHEEAMLVQTLNAISLRFQNRRRGSGPDPLAHLEIAPLWPLNNLLWGYIQDDRNRLSVSRRAYEYNHHYGLTLYGKAISDFSPADSRSSFLEAFHNLLYLCKPFFQQDDDATVVADGFPILNALREVHLLLAQGAHNQFGDLPWTARVEMLIQQWLLSRPEMREFLHSRAMVPYQEDWMPQVDTMKTLQGWTDVSVSHFHELAKYGEQILLSVRYGDWSDVNDPLQAANWARYWRPEIQRYVHAYRVATSVDLAADARDSRQAKLRVTQPSVLLRKRLASGPKNAALPAPTPSTSAFRERRAARSRTG